MLWHFILIQTKIGRWSQLLIKLNHGRFESRVLSKSITTTNREKETEEDKDMSVAVYKSAITRWCHLLQFQLKKTRLGQLQYKSKSKQCRWYKAPKTWAFQARSGLSAQRPSDFMMINDTPLLIWVISILLLYGKIIKSGKEILHKLIMRTILSCIMTFIFK